MPAWASIVVGAAAFIAAALYIWQKVRKAVRSVAKGITTMDKLLPVAVELAEVFHDAPDAFLTLRAIAREFKADSGTSLRDVINRLESAADDNRQAAEQLKINAEAERRLAAQDRIQLANLIAKLDLAAEGRVTIAENLEAAHERAEAEPRGADPGIAADAAARRPDDE